MRVWVVKQGEQSGTLQDVKSELEGRRKWCNHVVCNTTSAKKGIYVTEFVLCAKKDAIPFMVDDDAACLEFDLVVQTGSKSETKYQMGEQNTVC
eukprot:1980615-Amphidinium_carterae.1